MVVKKKNQGIGLKLKMVGWLDVAVVSNTSDTMIGAALDLCWATTTMSEGNGLGQIRQSLLGLYYLGSCPLGKLE